MYLVRIGRWILFANLFTVSTCTYCEELISTQESKEVPLILHLNGYAYHFKRADHNEKNYGVGFSYRLATLKNDNELLNDSQLSFEMDIYHDSFNHTGYAFGVAWQRKLSQSWDWGMNAGLVHEDHLASDTGLFFFPYVLPFIETRFNSATNLRVMLTPPFRDVSNGMLIFQLMLNSSKL